MRLLKKILSIPEPRFAFPWSYEGRQGSIKANTKSEARAILKRMLGIKGSGRLPKEVVFAQRTGNRKEKEAA